MKSSILILTCLGALGLAPASLGVLPPAVPELPNLDSRTPAEVSTAVQAARQQAVSGLRATTSDARVEWDHVLGVPRFVTSANGFLTGPDLPANTALAGNSLVSPQADPNRVIKTFLNDHADLFGFNADALTSARVKRDYVTAHNGLRTVIWEQMLDGIPVYEGLIASHVTKRGELVSVSSRFVPDPAAAAAAGTPNRAAMIDLPAVSAAEAVARAAANLGAELGASDLTALELVDGPEKAGSFKAPALQGEARTKLVWLPMSSTSLRLCWRIELKTRNRSELYSVVVDAATGEVLVRKCLTNYATPASFNVFTSDSPSPFTPGWPTPNPGQPKLVKRTVQTLIALSTNASPNGWINDGGTNTVGNNVDAHLDLNADDQPDLPRPFSTNRIYDFPLDLTLGPDKYRDAAVVQLFYLNNFMHDRLYDLGFTEAAGNFQTLNFGRGGETNDAVQADAQDGGGTDNANFSTPPDGQPGRMQMYVFTSPSPARDGDLDAEVVCHEYTHGLSNRLVGGGVGISQLQPAGMGEGWSDFYALSLLSEPNDDIQAQYPMGGYVTYRLGGLLENYYYGIRRYPYTTDMKKNPLTFKDIDPDQADPHVGIPINPIFGGGYPAEVHNMGEVWCVTLWDARANIIDEAGYAAGNTTMLQLVTDGMKLSPPNPTFLEARDAIIQADVINSGGENRAALWIAFAKRGMGVNAVAPPAYSPFGVVEDYTLPDDVVVTPPDGILEVSVTPTAGAVVLAGTQESVFVRVTDGISVTNATIAATLNGAPGPSFRNDGIAPDKTANNSVYSVSMTVPTNASTATLVLVISAPGKETTTNTVSYVVTPPPPNDMFANAIKVPVAGATYSVNNKLATIETNEPVHVGLTNQAGSLWYTWSSGTATNVLVDTAGSSVDTLIGVYTGNDISKLTQVTSANDVGGRRQAFVSFDAAAGTAYRIAVASINTNNLGSLQVLVAPGRKADTNAPVLLVTSPPSGFTATTNRILVTGAAVEPQPYASGISRINIRITRSVGVEEVVVDGTGSQNLVESTNWAQVVTLGDGLNFLRVTAIDVAGNVSPPVTLQVRYISRDPINDLFNNATVLTNNTGLSTVNTTHATKESGEPLHANNSGGKSAWWSFIPSADGVLTLTTTNSGFDTLLAVYQGNRVDQLTPLAANDDAFDSSGFSSLSMAVRQGAAYRIAVDGFDGASGVVLLGYSLTPASVYNVNVTSTSGGTASASSPVAVANSTVVVTATPQRTFDFAGWTGSAVASTNPLSIVVTSDVNLVARFVPHPYTDGFESGGFTTLPWTFGGDLPWVVQNSSASTGQFAARSGAITDGQSSSLKLTVNSVGGTGAFDYRVSSEPTWDKLTFLMNGAVIMTWSGDLPWNSYQFPVPAGPVNLEWRYTKDSSTSIGLDAAFIDSLDLPTAPVTIQLANPTATGFEIQVQGQQGAVVLIQSTPDLVNWQNVSTNTVTGSSIQYTYPQPITDHARFYRVVTP